MRRPRCAGPRARRYGAAAGLICRRLIGAGAIVRPGPSALRCFNLLGPALPLQGRRLFACSRCSRRSRLQVLAALLFNLGFSMAIRVSLVPDGLGVVASPDSARVRRRLRAYSASVGGPRRASIYFQGDGVAEVSSVFGVSAAVLRDLSAGWSRCVLVDPWAYGQAFGYDAGDNAGRWA
jgi:hypothetical protein